MWFCKTIYKMPMLLYFLKCFYLLDTMHYGARYLKVLLPERMLPSPCSDYTNTKTATCEGERCTHLILAPSGNEMDSRHSHSFHSGRIGGERRLWLCPCPFLDAVISQAERLWFLARAIERWGEHWELRGSGASVVQLLEFFLRGEHQKWKKRKYSSCSYAYFSIHGGHSTTFQGHV